MTTFINLYVNQGEDYNITLNINDLDSLLDLENSEILGQMRKTTFSTNYYNMTLSYTGSENNTIALSIPANVSNSMKPGKYMYDIFVIGPPSSNLKKTKLVEGEVLINPRITRVESYV